jgi:hypothetical protein
MKLTQKQLRALVVEAEEASSMHVNVEEPHSERDQIASIYSDVYKEKHGIRPHGQDWDGYTTEEMRAELEDLYASPSWVNWDEDFNEEPEIKEEKQMKLTKKQLQSIIQEVIAGETVGGTPSTNCDCGAEMPLAVQRSGAGYYLGYFCPNCGPYSRESGYYDTREEAQADMEDEYGIASNAMRVPPPVGKTVSESKRQPSAQKTKQKINENKSSDPVTDLVGGAIASQLVDLIDWDMVTNNAGEMVLGTADEDIHVPVRYEDLRSFASDCAKQALNSIQGEVEEVAFAILQELMIPVK